MLSEAWASWEGGALHGGMALDRTGIIAANLAQPYGEPMSEAAAEPIDSIAAQGEGTSPQLLPFSFARRFGAVITNAQALGGELDVACREPPSLATLAEIKRYAGRPIKLRLVSAAEFDEILGLAYARDSSAARQMVEDMGDEMDLASLAESVPETEDLLEQEDNAPIIRLINALLAEAIRENAPPTSTWRPLRRTWWCASGWTGSCAKWCAPSGNWRRCWSRASR